MRAPIRLAAFAALLALVFGGAALAGAAIDPTGETPTGTHRSAEQSEHGGRTPAMAAGDVHGADRAGAATAASGLAVSDGGYDLVTDRTFLAARTTEPFTFHITDDGGRVVRDAFELEHDKRLHLIVVRRDTALFTHVHPRQDEDGTWSVDLNLREPGVYRAFADFKIDGERRTLATDLFVPGEFRPNRLPPPVSVARAVDDAGTPAGDLDVTRTPAEIRAGRETRLTFAVTRDGRAFDALEPYLGAKGHLVALREGDLAYLHVHPADSPGTRGGHEVAFMATFPTAGRYRLFLQFQTGGEVRTVAYTVEVSR